jgi:hypothetical protein
MIGQHMPKLEVVDNIHAGWFAGLSVSSIEAA